jgi:hypothetical protein
MPEWLEESQFSYDYYARLVNCVSYGRLLIRFADLQDGLPNRPVGLLRHDIDLDIDTAVVFAAMEARGNDVKATYFVRPDAPQYTIDSDNVKKLRYIFGLGHEIGLHYTPNREAATVEELETNIGDAAAELENRIGLRIASFSIHRPDANGIVLGGPLVIGGLVNACAAAVTQEPANALYVSDSHGRWRYGDPIHRLAGTSAQVVQVLTHPYWWSESGLDPSIRFALTKSLLGAWEGDSDSPGGITDIKAALGDFADYDVS